MKKISLLIGTIALLLISGCENKKSSDDHSPQDLSTLYVETAKNMARLPAVLIDCTQPDINKIFNVAFYENNTTYLKAVTMKEFCEKLK